MTERVQQITKLLRECTPKEIYSLSDFMSAHDEVMTNQCIYEALEEYEYNYSDDGKPREFTIYSGMSLPDFEVIVEYEKENDGDNYYSMKGYKFKCKD